jgi:arylsulfatase
MGPKAEEVIAAALDFIDRAHQAGKPFFVWWNSTRMHIWTHLKKESEGDTSVDPTEVSNSRLINQSLIFSKLVSKRDQIGITSQGTQWGFYDPICRGHCAKYPMFKG